MSTYNFDPPPPPAPPDPPPSQVPPPSRQAMPPYSSVPPTGGGKPSRTWLWVVIGGGIFFLFVLAVFGLVYFAVKAESEASTSAGLFREKIAVVDLEGVIFESKHFVEQLKKYEDDGSIKAIIIRINSPGGGSTASQEIYNAVKRVADKHEKDKKKNKPVVSYISTVGASGGYYVATGTNRIFATRSSIVGSIGVIAQWVNYGDLFKWAKLKDVTFKAGELKDAGNPTREMTPEEKAYFQELIDNMHGQFIHDVAVGRKMKDEDIKLIANGRVWTGEQAKPMKLVDDLGDFQFAVDETAKMVGISGEPTLVTPQREKRTLADILFGDISDLIPDKAKMLQDHAGFYYLWKR